MGSDIKRPAYLPLEASDVADAANLIAAEARAADRTVLRPFSGSTLEGRPTWTAAHTVMWWHVDQERARDKAHDTERDALHTRAEAAEQRAEAAEAALAAALDDVELERGRVEALEGCVAVRNEALDDAHAELAQARADRALLIGLWLATVPPDVLPALLPADPGDRDRLAAALDAVGLQSGTGSHTAAGRSVIARIVAAAGGAR
jgi:hypothetical protein